MLRFFYAHDRDGADDGADDAVSSLSCSHYAISRLVVALLQRRRGRDRSVRPIVITLSTLDEYSQLPQYVVFCSIQEWSMLNYDSSAVW